jgi:hypothetical protein
MGRRDKISETDRKTEDTWTERKIAKKLTQQTKSSGNWRSYIHQVKIKGAATRGTELPKRRWGARGLLEQALYCNARDGRLKQPVNYSDRVIHRQRQGSALVKYQGNFLGNYSVFFSVTRNIYLRDQLQFYKLRWAGVDED